MPAPIIKHRYTDFGKDRIQVTKFTINYKDLISLEYLYMLMHEWLVDHGYSAEGDASFPERMYVHREGPGAKDVSFKWRVKKVPAPDSQLWRYDLDIDVMVLGLKDVEFVWKGKKMKAEKGEVEVNVVANLILDYEKAWAKHPFWKKYKNFIFNTFLKSKREFHEGSLVEEAKRFQDAIKTYLKIETYLPEKELEFYKKRPPE